MERQWHHQQQKAGALPVPNVVALMQRRSQAGRELVAAAGPMPKGARILEVGAGSRGVIFYWDTSALCVGVDPLAVEYAGLCSVWQRRIRTCAAAGEALPFSSAAFDLVICDNVIDHAEDPAAIVVELGRVLKPGGVLYFSVNVHHPVYQAASWLHAGWNALGIAFAIGPFADHTVHLTPEAARRIVRSIPVRIIVERDGIADARSRARDTPPRHLGERLKRVFFKNARYLVVARKDLLSEEPGHQPPTGRI